MVAEPGGRDNERNQLPTLVCVLRGVLGAEGGNGARQEELCRSCEHARDLRDAVMLSSAALRQACFPARKGKGRREEAETQGGQHFQDEEGKQNRGYHGVI